QKPLVEIVRELIDHVPSKRMAYAALLAATPDGKRPHLLAPFDHPEPSRLLISGTGLTPDYPTSLEDEELIKWAEEYLNSVISIQPIPVPAK
ncbi:MAG: hypothetical protein D4R38_01175, partial [Dehalococcoidia bacterium]